MKSIFIILIFISFLSCNNSQLNGWKMNGLKGEVKKISRVINDEDGKEIYRQIEYFSTNGILEKYEFEGNTHEIIYDDEGLPKYDICKHASSIDTISYTKTEIKDTIVLKASHSYFDMKKFGDKTGIYQYVSDGKYVKSVSKFFVGNDTIYGEENIYYNKENLVDSTTRYDLGKFNPCYFTYKDFDEKGNWRIQEGRVYKNSNPISITKRTIEYY